MHRYERPLIAIAVALAALAGFVDAIAFSALGFFASFMSGNSTRMGVALSGSELGNAAIAGALLLAFLSGVIAATVTAHAFAARRKVAVMTLVTLLLVVAASLAGQLADQIDLLIVAAAMGAANGVFARDGEVTIGVTYMTGSLVKLGQKLAAALIGEGDRWAWLPYLALWAGFAAGAVMGAGAYLHVGMGALWVAVVAAAVLTGVVAWVAPKAG
ncbi:MAG: DUF1275 family protein [Pseudomonadota bacterium]